MRRLFWIIPTILFVSLSMPAKVVDRIVAQVNGDIITLSELNREMAQIRRELATKYTGDQLEQEAAKAEKEALEDLIREKLLLQKANELGFNANADSQVTAMIQRIMKDNNLKETQDLENGLAQQGMNLRDFRDQLRRQIITRDLVNEFVGSRITVLSEEVEKFYKDHAKDYTTAEEVSLSEIVIPTAGDDKEAEARANDIHQRLKQGESFATLASQYSKGPTASKGGSIGSYITAKLNPETAKAIASVKETDISTIQRIKEGFVIYRVDTRKPASVRPLEGQVREEIKNRIYEQKFNPEFDRFIAQLKEDAYIQIFTETK